MITALMATARKVLGLFVDDGTLALSILGWILAAHAALPNGLIEEAWAAPVLFLGCLAILVENVLRATSPAPRSPKTCARAPSGRAARRA